MESETNNFDRCTSVFTNLKCDNAYNTFPTLFQPNYTTGNDGVKNPPSISHTDQGRAPHNLSYNV